jgi:hypothetical protein
MTGTELADIYTNARCQKIYKKNSFSFTGAKREKTGQTAAAKEAARPGRPAGGGPYGGPYRRFGPCFRGADPFSRFGEKDAGAGDPG